MLGRTFLAAITALITLKAEANQEPYFPNPNTAPAGKIADPSPTVFGLTGTNDSKEISLHPTPLPKSRKPTFQNALASFSDPGKEPPLWPGHKFGIIDVFGCEIKLFAALIEGVLADAGWSFRQPIKKATSSNDLLLDTEGLSTSATLIPKGSKTFREIVGDKNLFNTELGTGDKLFTFEVVPLGSSAAVLGLATAGFGLIRLRIHEDPS